MYSATVCSEVDICISAETSCVYKQITYRFLATYHVRRLTPLCSLQTETMTEPVSWWPQLHGI